ncbi:MAG: hypothetical protein H6738_06950 [Alphaproteobacteria bacterium]|nr:hypothetical protein [Alphaproteobacteria bacterium]MCB9696500.1 hypothetical protein [Alphaproteobacteria bacterium]
MEIRSESRIHYPRETVYRAYRDRLPEIAEFIPDIKEIVVRSKEDAAVGPKIHNEWIADREIPAFATAFLKPEHLRWDDHAQWDDTGFHVDWTLKTRAFTDAVRCSGRNAFLVDGDGTRVLLTGDLQISVHEIPGIPSFLGKRLAPQVEKFIVSLITPNLERVNASIERFLDARG